MLIKPSQIRMDGLRAFTYIELLITLAVIAVLFVPIMQLFSHSLHASDHSQNLITATSLARWEMERLKNLNATKAQLHMMGDRIHPPLDEEPLEMNQSLWRIKRHIVEETDPLEVRVHVYVVGRVLEEGNEGDGPVKLFPDSDTEEEGEETAVADMLYVGEREYEPFVTLVTLIEDMFWEEVQAIR